MFLNYIYFQFVACYDTPKLMIYAFLIVLINATLMDRQLYNQQLLT